ncbi:MAG: hypothetical protein Q9214_003028, partial [Letrouitia sp. 1 TL-2023]
MGILSKRSFFASPSPSTSSQPFGKDETGTEPAIAHKERAVSPRRTGGQLPRGGDGDTAMTLFAASEGNTEIEDSEEERKLERKIDFMILPYLAVYVSRYPHLQARVIEVPTNRHRCYAFFYIDKTTLSYAAIFDIQEDLNLHGTQYNWLSSIFYFGFLFFALPTNLLMQRLPIGIAVDIVPKISADYEIGKYLGFNIFMW